MIPKSIVRLNAALTVSAIATLAASLGTSTSAVAQTFGPDTCRQGFVWREAIPSDHVCVTPASRALVRQENALAASRRNPTGAYGSDTCISGFVWREAFSGDHVCVTPARRSAVRQENALAASRRAP
jgi:hypothetical protein